MDRKIYEKLIDMVGRKTTKSCPECGAVMVVRYNHIDDSFFLGCNRYPNCKRTMEIDEALRMELIGQPKLI